MRRILRAGKWLSASVLAVSALTACAEKTPDYSGEYEMLIGQNCDMVEPPNAFLELSHIGELANRTYAVKLPVAGTIGFPTVSERGSFNDAGELTVFFHNEPTSRFGIKSSSVMTLTMTPHSEKPEHLLILRWEVEEMTSAGTATKLSVLDRILSDTRKVPADQYPVVIENLDLSNTSLCLGKISRLTAEQRAKWSEDVQASKTALIDAELARQEAMPFAELWELYNDCKSARGTPACQAMGQTFEARAERERIEARSRFDAMSPEDLAAAGSLCSSTRHPTCEAYYLVVKERKDEAAKSLREELLAMPYDEFSALESTYCTGRWSADCVLYRSLKADKLKMEVTRLAAEQSGQEAFDLEYNACNSGAKGYVRNDELCGFRRKVKSIKRTERAPYFKENPAELRRIHNGCVDNLKATRKARNHSKSHYLTNNSFDCVTAMDAARLAGHRGQLTGKME